MQPAIAPGDRVQLIHTTDPYTDLVPGTKGTVSLVDALGTIHVKWDNGSNLGMIEEDGDRIHLLCPLCEVPFIVEHSWCEETTNPFGPMDPPQPKPEA
jgi:hypothetical protein